MAASFGGLLLLAVLSVWILYPRIGRWAVENKVLPKLERKLDRKVTVGSIDVTRGKAVLKNVVIRGALDHPAEPLARLAKVTIRYAFWPSLRGKMIIHDVVVDGATAVGWRDQSGRDNFSDVIDRMRRRRDKARSGGGGLRAESIRVRNASLEMRDEQSGSRVLVPRIDGYAERGGTAKVTATKMQLATGYGPRTVLEKVIVSARLEDPVDSARIDIEGGDMALWPRMSLSGIAGSITKGDRPGRMVVDLSGGYGGVEGRLWEAQGWVEPRKRTASIELSADRFTFDRLAPILKQSMVVEYAGTSVDAELSVDVAGGRADFNGKLALSKLNLYHPKVADKTIRNISMEGDVDGVFDRAARTLTVRSASMRSRGVDFKFDGYVHLPGGVDAETGNRRAARRLAAHLVVPKAACQHVLDAIPAALVPHLQGFKLRGTFQADLRTTIDWANLDATKLGGSVGIRGCRVKEAPPAVDAKRLKRSFTHYAEVDTGKWIAFDVGQGNPDYVPLHDVSVHVVNSFLTTEDSRFYRHRGFIYSEFKSALIKNLKAGRFRYGASSITMQLVKNVLLHRSKLLSRKFQELFLTWYLESKLSKDRMMELYVNVIEFGPGIYGIGPAARHYFDKHPRELNPVEAAFFSSILPNPKRRHRQYCAGKLWTWSARKIRRYIDIMYKRKRLTDEEYMKAQQTKLEFARNEDMSPRQCRNAAYSAMKKASTSKKPDIDEID